MKALMEHLGTHYIVVQGIRGGYKWSINGLEGLRRLDTVPSRAEAIGLAKRAIEKAAAKKSHEGAHLRC